MEIECKAEDYGAYHSYCPNVWVDTDDSDVGFGRKGSRF